MPAGTWTVKTDVPSGRRNGGGAGLGPDTGYFYYGNTGWASDTRTAECHEYNKVGDFWTQKASGVNIDDAISAFSIGDDKAYAGPGNGYKTALNEYSKAGNAWAIKTSLAVDRGRENAAGSSLDLSGYLYGGTNYAEGTPKTDEYSQVGDSWAAKTDGSYNRYPAMCAISADLILSAYGYSNTYLQAANQYSQSGDSWSVAPDSPSPSRSHHAGQPLSANNTRGYFFGGYFYIGGHNHLDACEEYNPDSQLWESKTNMPIANYEQLSAQVGDTTAYIVGGAVNFAVCWEFAMPEVPEIVNLSPAHEQTGVGVDSDIQFDITHPDGIDPDTVNVQINGVDVIINGVFQPGHSGTITEI